ncbi:hypothetical protein HMPREF0476_0885 [Kingella kingae ATCC 23330]|uniref:Uncharacterized protein n=1 Tax=Kingella kingae ATCC 23330 TaxID=887327 RepID=F5S6Q2_KINKI|nr:hypothetical protein HMPREF0476_0885 [Kingella kingae ATCC 23330]
MLKSGVLQRFQTVSIIKCRLLLSEKSLAKVACIFICLIELN